MIQFISHSDYEKLKNLDERYYSNRWIYYKKIINFLCKYNFTNALELGPYKFSIIKTDNVDIMDIEKYIDKTILHDANIIPWPIESKKYDLFIGLQVLEHLDNQEQIFNEIKRISQYAIISLPYKWKDSDENHNNIDEEVILKWTNNLIPIHQFIIKDEKKKENGKYYDRIVCFYKF